VAVDRPERLKVALFVGLDAFVRAKKESDISPADTHEVPFQRSVEPVARSQIDQPVFGSMNLQAPETKTAMLLALPDQAPVGLAATT
jgi:hypothetical protein